MQKRIVHFEGLVVFIAAIYAYSVYEFSWIIFFCSFSSGFINVSVWYK